MIQNNQNGIFHLSLFLVLIPHERRFVPQKKRRAFFAPPSFEDCILE